MKRNWWLRASWMCHRRWLWLLATLLCTGAACNCEGPPEGPRALPKSNAVDQPSPAESDNGTSTDVPSVRTTSASSPGAWEHYPDEANGEASARLEHSTLQSCNSPQAPTAGLRLVTWNIKAARSGGLPEIATSIAELEADVVALQEVDWLTRRSGAVEQARELAATLGVNYVFAGAIKWDGGDYGLALLSRLPIVGLRRHRLPTEGGELRIVLEVELCANGSRLHVFNHHASISAAAREGDIEVMLPIVSAVAGQGAVTLGDFNEAPNGPGVGALLVAGYTDPFAEQELDTTIYGRLDYVLLDGPLFRSLHETRHWPTTLSDHSILGVDLNWP